MAGDNQIAIIALADRPTILVDYTSNTERLEQASAGCFPMSVSGMTLLDAHYRDLRGAAAARSAPRGDRAGHHQRRGVHQPLCARRHQRLSGRPARPCMPSSSACSTSRRPKSASGGSHGRRRAQTGGQHVTLLAEMAVEQALAKLARELSSQYKVVYGRPESLIPPEEIEVTSAAPGSPCAARRRAARLEPDVKRVTLLALWRRLLLIAAAAGLARSTAPAVPEHDRHRLAQRDGDRRREPLHHRPRSARFLGLRGRRQAGHRLLHAPAAADRAVAAARQQREHGGQAGDAAGGRHQFRQAAEAQRHRAGDRLRQPRVDPAGVHRRTRRPGGRHPPDRLRRLHLAAQRDLHRR